MSRNKHVFKDKRGPALLWITTPSPYQRNNLQIIALLLLADSELRVGSRGGSSPEKRCCWLARVNTLAKSPNLPPTHLKQKYDISSLLFLTPILMMTLWKRCKTQNISSLFTQNCTKINVIGAKRRDFFNLFRMKFCQRC